MDILKKFSLKDKTVVITGGTGLLGSVYTHSLLSLGASVIVIDKKIDKTKFIKNLIKEYNLTKETINKIKFVKCDITNKKQIDESFKKICSDLKNLKVLINNASLVKQVGNEDLRSTYKPFLQMKQKDWEDFFSVDLTGALLVTQKCIPFLQKNGGGSIINISSTYGILSPDQRIYDSLNPKNAKQKIEKPIGYSISKSGVLNMTRFLATKFAEDNIRVNTLTLGGVYANNPKTFVNSYSNKTPLRRMADKNEYAGPIIFLATDASSYMTGSNLVVDGGWSTW
jgi:NAD(P)-dependent dehydrogenase (short-subunit alcohol dehydrogenase family)